MTITLRKPIMNLYVKRSDMTTNNGNVFTVLSNDNCCVTIGVPFLEALTPGVDQAEDCRQKDAQVRQGVPKLSHIVGYLEAKQFTHENLRL